MADHNPKYTLDEAISSVGFGKFQGLALAYAGVGWISDSMEIMLLSFIGPAVQSDWKLSPSKESLLSTAVFAGMLVGSYFWGLISDSYGRRRSILGSLMVTVAAGISSALSPNYVSLVILRCLLGFGVGGGQVFALWFVEFVPTQNRGKWMIMYSSFWTFGSVIEASLGWIIMPRLGWRWLVGFSTLPSLAVLLLSGFIPESPRYLCVKGRTIEAQNILKKVAEINRAKLPPGILISDQRMGLDEEQHAPSEKSPLLSSAGEKKTHFLNSVSSLLTLFSSELIRITLPLWFLYFGIMFLYYGIILITSELSSGKSTCRTLTELPAKKGTNLYINVVITSLAETPGLIFSAIMVDKVGRKLTMKITCVLVFIVFLPLISPQNETVSTALLFGARMFIAATYSVVSTYAREAYPTSVRSVGAGIASAIGRISGMVCPFVAVGLVMGCVTSRPFNKHHAWAEQRPRPIRSSDERIRHPFVPDRARSFHRSHERSLAYLDVWTSILRNFRAHQNKERPSTLGHTRASPTKLPSPMARRPCAREPASAQPTRHHRSTDAQNRRPLHFPL